MRELEPNILLNVSSRLGRADLLTPPSPHPTKSGQTNAEEFSPAWFLHCTTKHWYGFCGRLNGPTHEPQYLDLLWLGLTLMDLFRVTARRWGGSERLVGVTDSRGDRGVVAVAERGGGRVRLLHYAPPFPPFYAAELTHLHRYGRVQPATPCWCRKRRVLSASPPVCKEADSTA